MARLLALGADTGLQSANCGSFATHWACYGKQSSSLALLLNAGASMTAPNNYGHTPLMMAAAYRATDCVALLLARFEDEVGAQLGMGNNNFYTAEHISCCNNHPSILALLLDAGGSTNARNNRGRAPLMLASEGGATECVALLLEKGGYALDLDAQEDHGFTALHLAVRQGHHQAVSLLIRAGADPTKQPKPDAPRDGASRGTPGVHRPSRTRHCRAPAPPRPLQGPRPPRCCPCHNQGPRRRSDQGPPRSRAAARGHGSGARLPQAARGAGAGAAAGLHPAGRRRRDDDDKLVACLKYALGLEGGGGVVLFEGQEPAVGMLPEVFVELLELLVPKWDPAQKGRPLGEGV